MGERVYSEYKAEGIILKGERKAVENPFRESVFETRRLNGRWETRLQLRAHAFSFGSPRLCAIISFSVRCIRIPSTQ